jgi:DNA-binding NtrC family response regulator
MKQGKTKRTLLVIDDDRVYGEAIRDYLASDRLEVLLAFKAADGLTLCSLQKIDVVILDQQLPDGEGAKLCEPIMSYNDRTKIIFATAYPSFESAVKAIRLGAHDYLSKPFDLEEIALAVKQALRTLDLEQVEEVQRYQQRRESDSAVIIGAEGFAETMRLVDVAAATDSPVLITGETGTGKTLIAKAIHYRGRPDRGPFISVNCAALPENLIEAELFGFEKGAFTGAVASKRGIFEMAEGGTLFLDEIGEIPLHLQSKLLSALEDRRVRRIGGEAFRPANARIIAATSVHLEDHLGSAFRKDLYYRLSVVRIHVPALRERRGDIPLLCRHLLDQLSGGSGATLDEQEIAGLTAYDWPGNVRELRNVLERAVLVGKDGVVCPSSFLENIAGGAGAAACPGGQAPAAAEGEVLTLDEVEKRYIDEVLKRLSNNYTRTAKALGISLSTLKRKLKELEQDARK